VIIDDGEIAGRLESRSGRLGDGRGPGRRRRGATLPRFGFLSALKGHEDSFPGRAPLEVFERF
jgi:hypothetical protein